MTPLDLKSIASTFLGVGAQASVHDEAGFILVEKAGRAVEISGAAAGIWVEYWDRGEEYPKFDRMFPTPVTAVDDAYSWLFDEKS